MQHASLWFTPLAGRLPLAQEREKPFRLINQME
jgi:hypothetical protein